MTELAIFDTDSFFAMVHNASATAATTNSGRERRRTSSSGGGGGEEEQQRKSSSRVGGDKKLLLSSTKIFLIDSLPPSLSPTTATSYASFTAPGYVHSSSSTSGHSPLGSGGSPLGSHGKGSSGGSSSSNSNSSRYVTLQDELRHRNLLTYTWQYKDYNSFTRFMQFTKQHVSRNLLLLFQLFQQQQQGQGQEIGGGSTGVSGGSKGELGGEFGIERGFLAFEIDQRCAFVIRRVKPSPQQQQQQALSIPLTFPPPPLSWFQVPPVASSSGSSLMQRTVQGPPFSQGLDTVTRSDLLLPSTTQETERDKKETKEKEKEMESCWCYIYPEDLTKLLEDPMITFGQLLTQLFPQLSSWYPIREIDPMNVIVKYWPVTSVTDDDMMNGPCCEETLLQPLPNSKDQMMSLQTIGSLNTKAVTIVSKLALAPAYHNFVLECIT